MTPDLRATLTKVALPLAAILLPFLIIKLRGFDAREMMALRRPSLRLFALWIGIWLVWMAVTELALHALHVPDPTAWPPYPHLIIALRILAIGILGPIAEELIFRGLLFGRLLPRFGPALTIASIALLWGLIHIPNGYDAITISLICLDGLVLGYARYRTGSVFVPMVMHILGNLYSIHQSLG